MSKKVELAPSFKKSAAKNEIGALAYILMSSFGTPMSVVVEVVNKIVKSKDVKVFLMCLVSAVNVRGNMQFVTDSDVKTKYPELYIASARNVGDDYNFTAMRYAGHLLCGVSTNPLLKAVNNKAGNCVFGGFFPDSVAGKLNRENYDSLTEHDRKVAADFKAEKSAKPAFHKIIEDMAESVGEHFERFMTEDMEAPATKAVLELPVTTSKAKEESDEI